MKQFIRRLLPQWVTNHLYHLPVAIIANVIYGFPSGGLKVIGVTGTDGKTTTVNMIYRILKDSGKKVSMISTINAVIAGKTFDTGFHVTSPNPFELQRLIAEAAKAGDNFLVLEVTSHALDQFRFWGVNFEIGVITNVTHEHLDYHKTFENYLNTKLNFIRNVQFAVINYKLFINYPKIKDFCRGKILTFGLNKGDVNQDEAQLNLVLRGVFNIENALGALATAFILGINKKSVRQSLEDFAGLTGRMEEVKNNKGIKVIVDFAHTPNGLEQALKTLKLHKKKRLISLIGAEGFRDQAKRPMMGNIAQKLSDIVIVTAVDPRGQIETINKQIVEGAQRAMGKIGSNLFVLENREEAIDFAINHLAKRGDTVALFGKGHESSMNLDGKKEIPWSDTETVKEILNGQ